jgi:cytochrome c5
MKKNYLFLAATLIAVLVIALGLKPAPAISQKATKQASVAPLPDDVGKIFKNSCMACHGEGGKGMAMSHVNFSKWSEYTPEKQASKAESICKVVTKGSMPPKSFKKDHPEFVPTEAQIKSICDWSASLNKPK